MPLLGKVKRLNIRSGNGLRKTHLQKKCKTLPSEFLVLSRATHNSTSHLIAAKQLLGFIRGLKPLVLETFNEPQFVSLAGNNLTFHPLRSPLSEVKNLLPSL